MRQVGHQRAGRACNRTLANAARPAIERGTDAPGGGSRKSTAPISGRHRRVATGPPEIGLTAGLSSNERVHFSAMPRTQHVDSLALLLMKARPSIRVAWSGLESENPTLSAGLVSNTHYEV